MILDANTLPAGPTLAADICIIGAGAAGITMAMELAGGRTEVLVLESGGLKAEAATQDLYAGSVVDERLHSPPDRYRQRRFGGTTTIWGGRCTPLDPIDLERRDYLPHSGWPIGLHDLTPYYPRANSLCEAGKFQYALAEAFEPPQRPMIDGFASENFTTDTLERFSCPTDFGARYGQRLRDARNVRVVLHANVTAVNLDESGTRVHGVTARTLRGREFAVTANHFVMAAGGLEAARLLLVSRDVHSNGIGNQHDVVGRYYMCHLAGTMGALTIHRPLSGVWNGYDVSADGIYCRRRIALTAEAQRRERVGNFICRLHHPRITDPAHRNAILSSLYLAKFVIPYEYGKRLHGEERISWAAWLNHLRNVAAGPLDAAGFAWHMLKDRKLAKRKFPSIIIKPKANLFSLDFHGEQQPNPSSRVTLAAATDALGMPRISIDWRYTAGDIETVGRAMSLLARDLRQNGVGDLKYDPSSVENEITRYGAYGGHHIGTARMGNDPRESVVDANCRIHGMTNLFVAGTAVFPTSSQANPTLTVVALALRLADHLKREAAR
jgi:choline dehydrogenase-like flavoprotein